MTKDAFARPMVARSGRLVRRAEKPQLPFVPFGLAPLAGLAIIFVMALGPVAFGWVQDPAERAARQALSEAGASWAVPRVSGQWIVLEGAPPSREAADQAMEAVAHAKTGVFLGSAAPVTRVTERFVWSDAPAQPSALKTPAVPLSQVPPSQGQAPPENRSACDVFMPALLAAATVEFDEGSETVRPANAPLLDSIVRVAAICPGALRIEGHTDNLGATDVNMDLSRKRANAVRSALIQRGMDPHRIYAEGHGAARPVADNATEAGRARNRRIEIRVVPPPT
jgi:outer membrane protein OmpA-like peptidoglycan-associated protein